MSEPQHITRIDKDQLVGISAELLAEGYRFVQVGCATLENSYELTYSYDKAYHLRNFRITLSRDEEIPSISVIYPNAFLYENELHDLFGLNIRNISVNYRGTLYRTSIKTPFSIDNVTFPVPPQPKAETKAQDATATVSSTINEPQRVP